MGCIVDVGLALTAEVAEEAAGLRALTIEWDDMAGLVLSDSGEATGAIWTRRRRVVEAPCAYVVTVSLGGVPAIRCTVDLEAEVADALEADTDRGWDAADTVDLGCMLVRDPLARAVEDRDLAGMVEDAGGEVELSRLAQMASGAWDTVEVLL